jgi:hypothetical protein
MDPHLLRMMHHVWQVASENQRSPRLIDSDNRGSSITSIMHGHQTQCNSQ